ncbi:MAG TPA: hypothetical protein VK968_07080 [Roseimicrobium sp.]|nr:hypothetical protein [Roseimicrobium sp.]
MKTNKHICILAFIVITTICNAAETTNAWFAGMLHPPKIKLALPPDFIVVSASPDAKTTKEFDMYMGNIWAVEKTARQFEYGADRKVSNTKDPLFYVVLSDQVAQIPGTDSFVNEANIVRALKAVGAKKMKSTKTKWGKYPVMSVTGERPDGSPIFSAWIGINSPDGWAILIDYRVPKGPGHPTKEEVKIWETFLKETKPD